MNPAKQTKLLFQVSFLERHNKAHESDCIECKADNAMIGSEWQQLPVCEHDMLKMRPCQDRIDL
jgi:hypothetical protein